MVCRNSGAMEWHRQLLLLSKCGKSSGCPQSERTDGTSFSMRDSLIFEMHRMNWTRPETKSALEQCEHCKVLQNVLIHRAYAYTACGIYVLISALHMCVGVGVRSLTSKGVEAVSEWVSGRETGRTRAAVAHFKALPSPVIKRKFQFHYFWIHLCGGVGGSGGGDGMCVCGLMPVNNAHIAINWPNFN